MCTTCMSSFADSAEMGRGEITNQERYASQNSNTTAINKCTPAEVQNNQAILNTCNSKWSSWGIDPAPPASELRDPNNCSSLVSTGTLQGCADAIIALPIFMAELGARAMIATLPTDKNTLAFVSQHGSQEEINAFLGNEFMEETCGISKATEANYVSLKCEQSTFTNSHTASTEASSACRQQGLAEIQAAAACRKKPETRAKYRAVSADIRARGLAIKTSQDEKRRLEEQFQSDLAEIKNDCRVYMNPLHGSMLKYLAPFRYLAKEAQNIAAPRASEVQLFNDCVETKTRGNIELRQALEKQSMGLMAQIAGSFSALKCYNERERKKLMCEVALGVMTGGAGISAALARKLGPGALSGARRFTGRGKNITSTADDAVANTVPSSINNTVARNAQLNDTDRIAAAQDMTGRRFTAFEQQSLLDAHNVGANRAGAGVGNYTQAEIAEKTRILREAGFSQEERRRLMEAGIAGRPVAGGTTNTGTVLTGNYTTDIYGRRFAETVPYRRPAGYPASATDAQIRRNLNAVQSRRTILDENPSQPDNARLLAGTIQEQQRLRTGTTEMTDELRTLYRKEAENLDSHFNSSTPNGRNRDPLDVSNAYAEYASTLPPGPQRQAAIQRSADYREKYSSTDAHRREQARMQPRPGTGGERVTDASVHANDYSSLREHARTVGDPLARARAQAQMEAIAHYAQSQGWNMRFFSP